MERRSIFPILAFGIVLLCFAYLNYFFPVGVVLLEDLEQFVVTHSSNFPPNCKYTELGASVWKWFCMGVRRRECGGYVAVVLYSIVKGIMKKVVWWCLVKVWWCNVPVCVTMMCFFFSCEK